MNAKAPGCSLSPPTLAGLRHCRAVAPDQRGGPLLLSGASFHAPLSRSLLGSAAMDRSEWELAFALLGGRGLRPRQIDGGVAIERGDGSTLTVRDTSGGIAASLVADGPLVVALLPLARGDDLVEWILELLEQHPVIASEPPVVSHFPPRGELERTILTVAYVAYRPELDALARAGVHAYLEGDGGELRIFGDLAPSLLLDVSLEDAGVPPLGPGDGDWRVYLTTPEGERELTVARGSAREDDARELAAVVAAAVAQTP